MSAEDWFDDATDARKYVAEVGRLWFVWLVGLGALLGTSGGFAFAVGATLLVAMFILMKPLQQRVQDRFGSDSAARRVPARQTLSSRDKALRELTYGRGPFAEAVTKAGLRRALIVFPWLVIMATLAAGAAIAVVWLSG